MSEVFRVGHEMGISIFNSLAITISNAIDFHMEISVTVIDRFVAVAIVCALHAMTMGQPRASQRVLFVFVGNEAPNEKKKCTRKFFCVILCVWLSCYMALARMRDINSAHAQSTRIEFFNVFVRNVYALMAAIVKKKKKRNEIAKKLQSKIKEKGDLCRESKAYVEFGPCIRRTYSFDAIISFFHFGADSKKRLHE